MGACNSKRFVRLCCGTVLAISLLMASGCAPWRPMQSAEAEAEAGGEEMSWFPLFPNGAGVLRGTGYLPKAREIERNLGL